jgi:hypothetical protein
MYKKDYNYFKSADQSEAIVTSLEKIYESK